MLSKTAPLSSCTNSTHLFTKSVKKNLQPSVQKEEGWGGDQFLKETVELVEDGIPKGGCQKLLSGFFPLRGGYPPFH